MGALTPKTDVVLGSYVLDAYGRRGRVVDIHFGCPQSDEWLDAQAIAPKGDTERWVSILCEGGGSVCQEDTTLKLIEPFELKGNLDWEAFYFGMQTKVDA